MRDHAGHAYADDHRRRELDAEPPRGVPGRTTLSELLPPAVQQQMERAFGADFSDVRIRAGGEAEQQGALAFARGSELHFAPGQYDPQSTAGLELIGHELAHVVQQRQGRVSGPQGKGGVVADPALEDEADRAGARAARGLSAELGFVHAIAGGAASAEAPIQRKTAVGIVKDVAGSSVTRELIVSLVTQHKLELFFETIEKTALWWADGKLEGVPQMLVEQALGTGLVAAVQSFATWVNPFLGVLQTLRSIYNKLPVVVQRVIAFGLGSGMARFLGLMVSPETAENMVSAVFVDLNLATGIDWMSKQLHDIAHTPASWIYNTVWDRIGKRIAKTTALTPATYAVEELTGAEREEPAEGGASGQGASSEEPRAESPVAPLVKKDLRYLWLEIDQPALARFEHRGRKSGGLDLPFKFGVNLFDTKMETREPQHVHLPWSGGFSIELSSIAIDAPVRLAPVFSIGAATLTKVRVNDGGLDFFAFQIEDTSFADGVVTLPSLLGSWSKSAGLRFGGALQLQVFGTRIDGRGSMHLDPSGGFEEAALSLSALDRFTVIPELLVLQNPGFSGKVAKGGKIDLSLFSDVASKFSIFELDARRAHVDYHHGKGHEFAGGVDHLTVRIGKHVRLDAEQLELDRRGLRVAEAQLLYEHDPASPDRAKQELSTIKGIRPELLSFTGLKSLTIGGKVRGLRIGAAAEPIAVEDAQLGAPEPTREPRDPSSERPVEEQIGRAEDQASQGKPDSRFHVDSVEPVLSKIGAKLFGVGAELDLANRKGTIEGEISYAPPIPEVGFEFHIVPGLAAFVSLAPSVSLGASVHGLVAMPQPDTFQIGGSVGASAELKVTAKAGAQVGSQLAAALRAGIFAEGSLKVAAKAGAEGTLLLDRQAKRLRASDKLAERPRITYSADAAVKASVGVVVSGHAFLFFNRELWRYTFKEWEFGLYHLEGEVGSTPEGEPQLEAPKGGFVTGEPNQPAIASEKLEDARAYLLQHGLEIQGSAEERRKLIDEVVTRYQGADEPVARRLDAAAEECAQLKAAFNERRMQMATQGGALKQKDFEELEKWRLDVEEHEEALAKAKGDYREVQLVLVSASRAAETALDKGEIDIADLEERIRRAAEAREQGTAQAERSLVQARQVAKPTTT